MSKFTDFLNLFMWDSIEDSEEEFNIDKALNDNWKKIDTKVKTHVTSVNEEINNFKEETNQKIENIQALPTGGTKGQVLTKQSETEGDANWEDIEANEVFVGNEEEAPSSAKIIVEDDDFEESAGLSKAEIFVGAEEPTTGEKVWFRKGKNHFNGELKAGTFLNGVPNTEMSTTRIRNTEYIGVKNNTDYTISAKYSKTLQINVMIYDEDKKFIKEVGWNNVPYTFTTTDTTKYIMFALRESSNANITTKDITEIQLEQGSKTTSRGDIITFEAPSKKTYTINQVDKSNPVAKYENEPKSLLGKFTYYVLEIGKDSYIKRVIALPGEHVQIKDGKVYINDEELQEDYLQPGVVTDVSESGFDDFVVPENCVFAMGDNRNHSTDCREFGCIPLEKIESKVWIRIWPLNLWGKVK